MIAPRRGEVWLADLDHVRGREQAGRRPVLVVSHDGFNRGPAELFIALPLTSKPRAIASRVAVIPPEGGLRKASWVVCEGIRSLSRDRLIHRLGSVERWSIEEVGRVLRSLLAL